MNFRVPEIFIGVLLTVAVFAMGATITHRYPENNYTYQEASSAGRNQGANVIATDDRLANYTWWLVAFTGVLAISTIGLWLVTWLAGRRQSREMQASLAVAVKAAEAAEKSSSIAEAALFTVEAAYPYVMIRAHGIDVQNERIRGVTIGDVVSFCFTNYGRTPAAITEVISDLRIAIGVPDPIVAPERPHNWITGEVIPAGKDSRAFSFEMNEGMFRTLYEGALADERNIIWFMGYARYNDVFANEYVLGFCFAFGTAKAEFYPFGGDGYNYRKKVKIGGDKLPHADSPV